jgi:hypothetical protein
MTPEVKQRLAEQFRAIILRANDGMKAVNKKGEVDVDLVQDIINDVESHQLTATAVLKGEEEEE